MKNLTALVFFFFLIMAALGLGKEIAHQTLPTPMLVLSALGIGMYVVTFISFLIAARACRKGKAWGLKYLKFMGGERHRGFAEPK